MKTERLTLLVTPEEKAAINARAAAMGMSASEFVRQSAMLLGPEDIAAMKELELLLPEFNAAVDRIKRSFAEIRMASERHEEEMTRLESDDYRDSVRRQVASDTRINWPGLRQLFGFDRERAA